MEEYTDIRLAFERASKIKVPEKLFAFLDLGRIYDYLSKHKQITIKIDKENTATFIYKEKKSGTKWV